MPQPTTLETDYLIIGAGAAGLAFADTLLDHSSAHITLVDRRGQPGGHWNDAYPFVRLHQPSAFYGVNSTELGSGRIDAHGHNAGMFELASGPEINAYYDQLMQRRLLPSGRVHFCPMSEYLGDGRMVSLLTGAETQVTVRRKTVDAAYLSPRIPATHTPRFTVADDAWLLPPGALPALWHRRGAHRVPRQVVVLGGGKTAMDTVVWLLVAGLPAEAIRWVVPRDAWLVNRAQVQPGEAFFDASIGGQADQMTAMAQATSVDDLFLRLEGCGALLRIDRGRTPSMFHLATMSSGEIEQLRQVQDVIRLGRVQAVHADRLVLDQGSVPLAPETLCIDCTASAVEPQPLQPIFQEGRIVLQMVRLPQPTFSAALIAFVETHTDDPAQQNRLCGTVPFPHQLADYPRCLLAGMANQFQWGQDKVVRQWIRQSRLDSFGKLIAGIPADDQARQATVARMRAQAMAAAANLPRLLS